MEFDGFLLGFPLPSRAWHPDLRQMRIETGKRPKLISAGLAVQ
jgi:hypothetical protein